VSDPVDGRVQAVRGLFIGNSGDGVLYAITDGGGGAGRWCVLATDRHRWLGDRVGDRPGPFRGAAERPPVAHQAPGLGQLGLATGVDRVAG